MAADNNHFHISDSMLGSILNLAILCYNGFVGFMVYIGVIRFPEQTPIWISILSFLFMIFLNWTKAKERWIEVVAFFKKIFSKK